MVDTRGVVGLLARLVVFCLIGGFAIRLTIDYDPNRGDRPDGALQKLPHQTYGPWLLGVTAAGLLAYPPASPRGLPRRLVQPKPVDLLHLGNERVIGVYVVDTPEGPALFDCGPATCFERLQEAVDLSEIRHLLLSHIHLDHAGAQPVTSCALIRRSACTSPRWERRTWSIPRG